MKKVVIALCTYGEWECGFDTPAISQVIASIETSVIKELPIPYVKLCGELVRFTNVSIDCGIHNNIYLVRTEDGSNKYLIMPMSISKKEPAIVDNIDYISVWGISIINKAHAFDAMFKHEILITQPQSLAVIG